MGKSARNKKKHCGNYKMTYSDEGPSLTVKKPSTQEEMSRKAIEKDIYERILILQEPRPICETLKFSDQHKKLLDSVLLDKLQLDGEVEIDEEEATEEVIRGYKKIREKNDPGVFVLPIRIEAKFGTHALADTGSNINVMPYRIYPRLLIIDILVDKDVPIVVGRSFLYTCGGIINTIKGTTSTFDGVCHQKFYVSAVRNKHEESDEDEDEYCMKRDAMGNPIYGSKFAKYLNCDDPMDRALALQEALNLFRKICVWKKMVAFLGSLPVPLQHNEYILSYSNNFIKKGEGDGKWHAKVRIEDPYRNVYDQGYKTKATNRKLPKFYKLIGTHDAEAGSSRPKRSRQYETVEEAMLPRQIYSPCIFDWGVLNLMGCAEEIEVMLEIKKYKMEGQEEFNEVVTNDELMTKKLIKFRLGSSGHTLTLLKFAQRLSLYHSAEINEEGFKVYFQGGLRSDDNFNARDYWLRISCEEELHLSRSLASIIRSPILRVLQKMITYGLCQRTTGYDKVQRNKLRMARRIGLLTDEVLNGLSAPTYCRALDATTLREMIDSNGRLLAEDPAPGVPRVTMPTPSRPYMQDLYDRMGNMEICQGHGVPLHGAYAPPGYDEEQQED
ncbi:hypothetical protein Tco_0625531 [Tanacetum coccineum]|uniref:Uncharacterized protein n=1 Tax=Tanacetum coccineum TaxID=301880 RepID=A0ABQ4WH81_9ASTR